MRFIAATADKSLSESADNALKMTDMSRSRSSSTLVMTSRPVYVTSSATLSFGISAILASSSSSSVSAARSSVASCVTSTATLLVGLHQNATASHLSYGSALTAAAIAAAERAYITSAAAAAAAAAFHQSPPSSSSSSSDAVAAASLWAAAAAAAAQRHTFIPAVMTSPTDHVTSVDHVTPADTLMPPAVIFPWMQERKDRLCGATAYYTYTVSQKTGPLGYSQIFPTDLDQYQ